MKIKKPLTINVLTHDKNVFRVHNVAYGSDKEKAMVFINYVIGQISNPAVVGVELCKDQRVIDKWSHKDGSWDKVI